MDDPKSSQSPAPEPDQTADKPISPAQRQRLRREAEALRANLRKRKDQARQRASTADPPEKD